AGPLIRGADPDSHKVASVAIPHGEHWVGGVAVTVQVGTAWVSARGQLRACDGFLLNEHADSVALLSLDEASQRDGVERDRLHLRHAHGPLFGDEPCAEVEQGRAALAVRALAVVPAGSQPGNACHDRAHGRQIAAIGGYPAGQADAWARGA